MHKTVVSHKNIFVCPYHAMSVRYYRISIIDRLWKRSCQLLNPFLSCTISGIKLKYFII